MERWIEFALIFSSAIVSFYLSTKALNVQPPREAFTSFTFIAKFWVWQCPLGGKWKTYLRPEWHESYINYQKALKRAWPALIVTLSIFMYYEWF